MLTTAESVERICASAKALLCLDACAVLDIARDPTRDKFSGGHASAAVELLGRAESAPPGLSLLMNMTVRDEISTNLDQVEAESGRRLERLDAAMRRTVGVLKAVGVSLLDAPPQLSDLQFPVAARLVVQRFLNAAHVVEDDADSKVRAIDRVGRGIAPASRAKQSAKDCRVVGDDAWLARSPLPGAASPTADRGAPEGEPVRGALVLEAAPDRVDERRHPFGHDRRGRPLIVVVVPAMMAPVAWVVRPRRWIRVTRVVRLRRWIRITRVVRHWRRRVVHDWRWRGVDDCWRRWCVVDRRCRLHVDGLRRVRPLEHRLASDELVEDCKGTQRQRRIR